MNVRLPDGTLIKNVPDDMSKADFTAKLKANGYDVSKLEEAPVARGTAMGEQKPIASLISPGHVALAAGLGRGVGNVALNIQELLGKGAQKIGLDQAGKFLQENAAAGQAAQTAELAPYKQSYPTQAGAGQFIGEVAPTLPIGGALGKLASYIPGGAGALVNALRTGGISTGLETNALARAASGLAPVTIGQRAADIGTRALAGGAVGAAGTALTSPADTTTGAIVGATVPLVLPPVAKALVSGAGFITDALAGNLAKIKAGRIATGAAGDNIKAIRAALAAAPEDVNAAQAAAGVDRQAWQSLGALAGNTDENVMLLKRQADDNLAILQRAAESGNATEARAAQDEAVRTLNGLTESMRTTALGAANQAGETINKLAPRLEQKRASYVSALREGMPMGEAGVGVSTTHAATEAAQRQVAAREQLARVAGAEGGIPSISARQAARTQMGASRQWSDTSAAFADVAAQRRAEAGFLERQIGSLADNGLRPLDAGAITASLDATINAPGTRASPTVISVLESIKNDIATLTAKNGGIIDAHDLYTLRKEGLNERIAQLLGPTDPKTSSKLTASILTRVKPLIDDAIEKAGGGPEWKNYLKTYATGMQDIEQRKMAAEAVRLFKSSPEEYVKLVRGNNPDAVEAIFGPGNYNIFKEMGSKMPTLEKVASEVERDAAMKKAAEGGAQELSRIVDDNMFMGKFPSLMIRTIHAANMTLDILEKRLNAKTMTVLREGMASGKTALEMLNQLPIKERSAALKAITDSTNWTPAAATVATRAATNALAPRIVIGGIGRDDTRKSNALAPAR